MKRFVNEPTVAKLKRVFPYSIEVPKGFRTHAQTLCRKTLGKNYYHWVPIWTLHYRPTELRAYRPWAINEDAVWQYKDGRLYFKDERNFSIVTMAMLSKPKK